MFFHKYYSLQAVQDAAARRRKKKGKGAEEGDEMLSDADSDDSEAAGGLGCSWPAVLGLGAVGQLCWAWVQLASYAVPSLLRLCDGGLSGLNSCCV